MQQFNVQKGTGESCREIIKEKLQKSLNFKELGGTLLDVKHTPYWVERMIPL